MARCLLSHCAVFALLFMSVRSEKGLNKLESRVSQLLEWNSRRSIITLSSEKFNAYVRSKPRNYSCIVMFTALKAGRGCSICKDAYDEYQIVASSWRYSNDYSSKLFFIMVDIDEDGVDAFHQLHITTAPTYFHFPPSGKRKPEDQYDVARNSYQAEPLAKWVVERTGLPINVLRPPNYTLLMIWLPVILCAFIIGYLKRENLHGIYEPKYWALAAMAWVFVMISGQMWNNIRGPPFAHKDPHTGATGYFSGTSQYQFIAETYIILLLYAMMSTGMILMNEQFTFFDDLGLQKVTPIVGLSLVVLVFGYLLSVFRMKYGGYPYRNDLLLSKQNNCKEGSSSDDDGFAGPVALLLLKKYSRGR